MFCSFNCNLEGIWVGSSGSRAGVHSVGAEHVYSLRFLTIYCINRKHCSWKLLVFFFFFLKIPGRFADSKKKWKMLFECRAPGCTFLSHFSEHKCSSSIIILYRGLFQVIWHLKLGLASWLNGLKLPYSEPTCCWLRIYSLSRNKNNPNWLKSCRRSNQDRVVNSSTTRRRHSSGSGT